MELDKLWEVFFVLAAEYHINPTERLEIACDFLIEIIKDVAHQREQQGHKYI
jgi:hypothetical protein